MQPVAVSPEAERGYYVIWNAETWARMRVSSVAHVLCSCADPHRSKSSRSITRISRPSPNSLQDPIPRGRNVGRVVFPGCPRGPECEVRRAMHDRRLCFPHCTYLCFQTSAT